MGLSLGSVGDFFEDAIGSGVKPIFDALNPDAVQQQQFSPNPVQSPFGSMSFNPRTREIDLQLSPEHERINQMFLGSMAGGPFGLSPEQMAVAGLGTNLGNQTFGLGQQAGLFGRGLGMQAGQAGSQFLSGAMNTNPQAIAANQFDMMQQLLQPARQDRRTATENRLLSQGLLTSTGGAKTLGELAQAENMQDIQLAQGALREGFNTQQGLFNMGLRGMGQGQGLFNAGTAQQQGSMGQGFGFMQAPLQQRQQSLSNFMSLLGGQQSLGNQLFNAANIGLNAGAQQSNIDASNAAARTIANQNQSDMMSGLLQSGMQIAMMAGM